MCIFSVAGLVLMVRVAYCSVRVCVFLLYFTLARQQRRTFDAIVISPFSASSALLGCGIPHLCLPNFKWQSNKRHFGYGLLAAALLFLFMFFAVAVRVARLIFNKTQMKIRRTLACRTKHIRWLNHENLFDKKIRLPHCHGHNAQIPSADIYMLCMAYIFLWAVYLVNTSIIIKWIMDLNFGLLPQLLFACRATVRLVLSLKMGLPCSTAHIRVHIDLCHCLHRFSIIILNGASNFT